MKPRWIFVLVLAACAVGILWLWRFHASTDRAPVDVRASPPPASVDSRPTALDAPGKSDGPAAIVRVSLAGADEPTARSTLTGSKRLSVLVIDAVTRAPLPGIYVEMHLGPAEQLVSDEDAKWLATVHPTGVDGRVDFPRDVVGPVDVRAYDPAEVLGSAVRELASIEDVHADEIVLELSPRNDVVFWMRIVDQSTHLPIAGAHVTRIVPTNPVDPTHRFITDASGLFLVRGPSWTGQTVQLDVPDHSTVFVQPVNGHEVPEKALEIEVWQGATVRAYVVDPVGAPVANVRIRLETAPFRLWRPDPTLGWSSFTFPEWTRITDDAGRATFEDLPANVPIQVEVASDPKWSPAEPLTLTPGEARDVRWNLRPGCRVHGRVTDGTGAPVARCEVWMLKANMPQPIYFDTDAYGAPQFTARTDEQGRFEFAAVGAGTWWIGPGRVKRGTEGVIDDVPPVARVLVLAEAQSDADLELRVDQGLFVTGHVLAPVGKVVGSGYVVVSDAKRQLTTYVTWDEDGAFSAGPLMPGELTLYAQSHSGWSPSESVVAKAGQSDISLQLRLGASFYGHVVDEKGEPVACKVLASKRTDIGYDNLHYAGLSPGEEFEFTGLETGVYSIAATTSDGKIGWLEDIDASEGGSRRDLMVRVVQGGRLRVSYEGSKDRGGVDVIVNGMPVSGGLVERGRPTIFTAPVGKVLVRVDTWGPDPIRERTVDVDVGVTTDVVIDYGAH